MLATQKAHGRLTGSIGGYGIWRAFDSQGEEALSPPVDQNGFALFGYEEFAWSHVTLQFGGRVSAHGLLARRRSAGARLR